MNVCAVGISSLDVVHRVHPDSERRNPTFFA
jgi:hypothetical protein